jgi:hypothetical protein
LGHVGFDRNGFTIPRRPFDSKPGSTFCENDNIGRCPGGAAADIRDGAALPCRFDVQGWNDLYRDRPGRLQRSRWCTESRQVGRDRCASRRGVAVSGCRPRAVDGCVKGRTGRKGRCDDRQHRSDRRHRQVQGRDLFEIEAAQGFLLAPWGRRRVLDEVDRSVEYGRRSTVARLFAQERTQSRPHIVQELWLPEFIGVHAVGLH